MENSAATRERIAAEATDWCLRLHDAARSTQDHQAFTEWLMRSPTHIEEFLAVSSTWTLLNVPEGAPFDREALIAAALAEPTADNVVSLQSHHRSEASVRIRQVERLARRRWLSLAATLLIGVFGALGYVHWYQSNDLATAIGEQRSVRLPDGSMVVLNTNSEVRVRFGDRLRHIDLVRGEARFQVAKNPARPFVVATPEATVRAVGTIFNVRADQASTQVAVIEGVVEVNALSTPATSSPVSAGASAKAAVAEAPQIELAAGERAAVTARGIRPNAGQSIERVTSWAERRLVFRAESLADVVSEFNRYRIQVLRIDDPQLAALQISGSFDPDDLDSLLDYLQRFESVRVNKLDDGSIHLARTTIVR